MSKRIASRELNHDNWDQEEEKEDAGTFAKATEEVMKERVVRKAKRRNLTEDQRTNVFSGFSFSSVTNNKTDDAFSFLKSSSSDNSESKENKPTFGFVFGGKKPDTDMTAKPFGGFVFGKAEEEKKSEEAENTKNKDDQEEAEACSKKKEPSQQDKWTCSTCMVGNPKEKEKCVCCETPKTIELVATPNSLSNFLPKAGNWTCDTCMISNTEDKIKCAACETPKPNKEVKSEAPNSLSQFMPKAGNWSCEICMISNKEECVKCAACEAPKPGVKPKDALFTKLTEASKNNWTCDVCMVSNKPEKSKCVACESAKPGSIQEEKEESTVKMSFGTEGGFKFTGTGSGDSKSTGGFSFASSTTAPPSGGGFTFKSSGSSSTIGGGFMSNSSTTVSSNSGGFTFGASTSPADSKPSTGFTFGSSVSAGTSVTENKSVSGFKFGATNDQAKLDSNSSTNIGLKSGDSSAPNTPQGFKFSKESVFGAPQGPFGTPAGQQSSPSNPTAKLGSASRKAEYLGQVKALNIQVTSWINKHVDANPLIDLSPVFLDYQKHISNIRSKFGVQARRVEPVSSVKEVSKDDESSVQDQGDSDPKQKEENETDSPPPHKEENSFFSTKCKLFLMKDGTYVEHGKGFIHLKKCGENEEKVQLIIRSDNSLATILLNVVVNESSAVVEKKADNNVLLVTSPNPPLAGEVDGPATFLIRVKKEQRDELYNHIKKD